MPGQPIVFKGSADYPRPVIKAENLPGSTSPLCAEGKCLDQAVNLAGASWITLDHLEVKDAIATGIWGDGANNIKIQDCVIRDLIGIVGENPAGIGFNYFGPNSKIAIRDCEIYKVTADQRSDGKLGGVDFATGILFYSANDSMVENNFIHDLYMGIDLKNRVSKITIRKNDIADVYIGLRHGCSTDFGGINGYDSGLNDIYENRIYRASTGMAFMGNGIPDCNVNMHDIRVLHNDIYNVSGGGIILLPRIDPSSTINNKIMNFLSRNNLVINSGSQFDFENWHVREVNLLPGLSSDYNIFFDTFESNVAYWCVNYDFGISKCNDPKYIYDLPGYRAVSGQDSYSMQVNPLFIDPEGGDFRIFSTSPAVDKGVYIPGFHCPRADDNPLKPYPADDPTCKHWNGKAPDIGVFETKSKPKASPTPPPILDPEKVDLAEGRSGAVGFGAMAALQELQPRVQSLKEAGADTSEIERKLGTARILAEIGEEEMASEQLELADSKYREALAQLRSGTGASKAGNVFFGLILFLLGIAAVFIYSNRQMAPMKRKRKWK